jgi:hypothetical protein
MKNWLNKYQVGGKISTEGYKSNSPDKDEPQLTIPSNRITMKGVDHSVVAYPNQGNPVVMYPGAEYYFPEADYVNEIPVKQLGGLTEEDKQKWNDFHTYQYKNNPNYGFDAVSSNKNESLNLIQDYNKRFPNKSLNRPAQDYFQGLQEGIKNNTARGPLVNSNVTGTYEDPTSSGASFNKFQYSAKDRYGNEYYNSGAPTLTPFTPEQFQTAYTNAKHQQNFQYPLPTNTPVPIQDNNNIISPYTRVKREADPNNLLDQDANTEAQQQYSVDAVRQEYAKYGKYIPKKQLGGSIPKAQFGTQLPVNTNDQTSRLEQQRQMQSWSPDNLHNATFRQASTDPTLQHEVGKQAAFDRNWDNVNNNYIQPLGYLNDLAMNAEFMITAPEMLGNVATKGAKYLIDHNILPIKEFKDGFNDLKKTTQYVKERYSPTKIAKRLSPEYRKETQNQLDAGNNWLKDWYSHPISQDNLLNNQMHMFMDKEIPTEQIINVNDRLKSGKYKSVFDNPILDILNKTHDDNLGIMNSRGSFVDRYPNISNGMEEGYTPNALNDSKYIPNIKSVTIHEGTHNLTLGNDGLSKKNQKMIADELFPKQYRRKDKLTMLQYPNEYYYTDPTEVHARVNELRSHYGLSPEDIITPEMGKKYLQDIKNIQTPINPAFANYIESYNHNPGRGLATVMNKLPALLPVGIGAAALSGEQKKMGGKVKSNTWLDKYK